MSDEETVKPETSAPQETDLEKQARAVKAGAAIDRILNETDCKLDVGLTIMANGKLSPIVQIAAK